MTLNLKTILAEIKNAESTNELESVRLKYLGRKGSVTSELKNLSKLSLKQRPQAGARLNKLRGQIEGAIKEAQTNFISGQIEQESSEKLDLTIPTSGRKLGHYHPVKEVEQQLVEAFWQIGFTVTDGPEIESEWYNFEALNIPEGHPARDMFDTFYVDKKKVLRTHTSSVQIRYMEENQPPIRIISLGRAYRNEDEDSTHLAVFRQIEGLVVAEGISLSDLKGTLLYMFRAVLGEQVEIKLLPSYFPFVEPALEVHVSCVVCMGKESSCRTCKGVGWIEMCGAGMVHPQVLKNVGIDSNKYSGFAFGGGTERITAIKHQIPDIRYFYRPDLRFIRQFR